MTATMAGRAWRWLIAPPIDDPSDADLRTADVAGLRLPVRASVAVLVATLVVLLDLSRVLVPPSIEALGHSPAGLRALAIERVLLYGLVPLGIVVFGFRDRPSRYGLRLGDARAGAILIAVGALVMTPVVLLAASLPDVRTYYAQVAAALPDLLLTNALELTAAEFLFRGFLMFTLVRAIGPLGVVIAVMPFAFGHVGKPVIELLSTVVGGLAYGWLAWRTRSILWGSIAHVYIVTLVTLAAAALPVAAAIGTALTR
jgi:membrane protease YdiL (CAAX protease family)